MKTPHFWWVKLNKIHRCYTPPPFNSKVHQNLLRYFETADAKFSQKPIVPKD